MQEGFMQVRGSLGHLNVRLQLNMSKQCFLQREGQWTGDGCVVLHKLRRSRDARPNVNIYKLYRCRKYQRGCSSDGRALT